MTLEEGFSFYETDLGDGTFAYVFEVVDLSNNEFQSDVVLFEYTDGEINYLTE